MDTDINVSFDIYNTESVKRLQDEDPDILPTYTVAESKDLAYNKKQINNAVSSAIIQGKSIDKIADDLQNRMESLNKNSAVKAARTGITNAQNAGTLSRMKELAAMGVDVQKEWVATLDDRTRKSHRKLDGERRDLDERFSNGLMYPGGSGSSKETWNCRCRMVSYLPDVDTSDAVRWSRDPNTGKKEYVPNQTYREWEASKKASLRRTKKTVETGKITGKIKVNGQNLSYEYDSNNDILTITLPDGTKITYNDKTGRATFFDSDGSSFDMPISVAKSDPNYIGVKKAIELEKAKKAYNTPRQLATSNIVYCEDFDELKKYYRNTYGIVVGDDVKNLDFKSVRESLAGADCILIEFPQAKGCLSEIYTSQSGLMSTSIDGGIGLNIDDYNDRESLSNSINAASSIGAFVKNASIQTIGSHEGGHLLEIALIQKSIRAGNYSDATLAWNESTEATRVVEAACASARKKLGNESYSNAELISQISGYALKDYSECMAECVHDYVANKENAAVLSREVWEILKGELG